MEYPYMMFDGDRGRFGYERSLWRPSYLWEDSREEDRDLEYLQSMYPEQVRRLQRIVEEECERQDYEGSPMYDEYPDRVAVMQMCSHIRRRAEEARLQTEQLEAEVVSRPVRPRRWGDTPLDQLIQILLFQEMHRRRRRRRGRRRWF